MIKVTIKYRALAKDFSMSNSPSQNLEYLLG
ncbi:MAG: hypothetical protein K0S74_923 [Chlamydiales bacterium]|jgi:hypothetical protein|nr:hypothetical protein [Chlamydiales bacterium]